MNCDLKKYYLLFIGFILITQCTFAQSKAQRKQFEKAKQYYYSGNLNSAKAEITKLLNKSANYLDAILLLADLYHETDSVHAEIKVLENALNYSDKPLIIYRLGQAAYSIGNYEKGLYYFKRIIDNNLFGEPRITEIQKKIANCNFAFEAIKHPVDFKPQILSDSINSENDEYWPSQSLDQHKIVFTRLVKSNARLLQEDFYVSEFNVDGWSKAKPISDINTNLNEGAQAISADGKLIFFTACNRADGEGSCDIYFSRFIGNRWSKPLNAGSPVSSKYWESQPSFSSDNQFLYFSSNRPGGFGEKDIWRVKFLGFNSDGSCKWGTPVNLGEGINTSGNEISSFIHPNNKDFYFASDFHVGMGGFDLFMSEIKRDGTFALAQNLGYPINTFEDEQGINISADGKTSYFSSARNPGTGLDIYSFEMDEEIRPDPATYVKANVVDAISKKPVSAKVDLIDLAVSELKFRSEIADENGEIILCLPLGTNYAFNVSEEGYLFYSQSFLLNDIVSVLEPYQFTIELQRIELGAEMNLYNIYFETNSFELLSESDAELQKLKVFLESNSKLQIQIQGHTDNTGDAIKNDILSENRAKSVMYYLVENGIEKSRIHFIGFGQNKPVASNETKEGRQLNRRTTIKIVEF